MEQKKGLLLLRFSLGIYALVALAYGIGYVFFPEYLVELSGGDPVPGAWLRWAGAVVIALGIGAIMVILNPVKQRIFVRTIAMGSFFVGLTLVYAWVYDAVGELWFTAVPAIGMLALAILLIVSCKLANETLK